MVAFVHITFALHLCSCVSVSDTIEKLVFTWADEPIQFDTEKGLDLAEFVFLKTETGVCAKNYSTGRLRTRIKYNDRCVLLSNYVVHLAW